jgi:uncharacterized protein YcbK (DUF882 family)
VTSAQGDRARAFRLGPGAVLGVAVAVAATICGVRGTQDAVANGDTRTISIFHVHSKESAQITFKRNGYYDQDGLKQLNWLLRDWRLDEPTRMEPRLFDIVWEVYREVGAQEPIHVVSAYRSPQTNAMLRRRSKAVSEHSQHMAGKAMDFHIPEVSMSRVREIAMRLQSGGVGFYPNSMSSFVHLDAGSVRSWPRMTSDQLARLFPDGRTVHLPRDGKPLGGYELAKAEILSRGGSVAGLTYADGGDGGERKSLWAMLFGGGDDEDSDFYRSPASRTRAAAPSRSRLAYADAGTGGNAEDGGMRGAIAAAAPTPVAEPAPARGGRRARTEVAALERPQAAPPVIPAEPAPGFEAAANVRAEVRGTTAPAPPAEANDPAPEPSRIVDAKPMPPRRPTELAALFLAEAPLPPERPITVAALSAAVPSGGLNGQMRSPSGPTGITAPSAHDDKAVLKALFDAAASQTAPSGRADVATARARVEPRADLPGLNDSGPKVRMVFSAGSRDDLGVDRFRGSAVAPLPTRR